MKQSKLLLSLGVFIFGFTLQSLAQIVLPEVKIVGTNYKYLKSVDDPQSAQPVQRLQREAATYDLKNSEFYEDEYDTYFISFYIPEGSILAVYDKDAKLIRTAEKYKNIKLPTEVAQAVVKKYPQWNIAKDVYLVNYYDTNDVKKTYKLVLENGNKRIRVKINEKGEFL